MPSKIRRGGKSAQAQNSKQFSKSLNAEIAARNKDFRAEQRAFEKSLRDAAKQREKEYHQLLKIVRGKGIYEPKNNELTKYRKDRLRQAKNTFGEYLNDKYFFIPVGKKAKAEVMSKAEMLSITHTRAGLFFSKQGHTRATIKKDKEREEYYIERSGKVKRGTNTGRKYKSILPLASLDELDRERERLRKLALALGPLKKNERLVFKVIENSNEGYSQGVFDDIELLLRNLDNYQKKHAARVNFFRHIQVEKSNPVVWRREHPNKARGGNRIGRGRFVSKGRRGND